MPVVQIRLLGEDLIWCSHCGEVDNKYCATEEQWKICPLTEKKDINKEKENKRNESGEKNITNLFWLLPSRGDLGAWTR